MSTPRALNVAFAVGLAFCAGASGAILVAVQGVSVAAAAEARSASIPDGDAGDASGPPVITRSDAGLGRTPPDPAPMRERAQWIFDFRYDKGDVYLLGVHRVDLPSVQETPRAMGRFALELFEGPTLIERVRFDFPLLGAGPPRDAGPSDPDFQKKLTTRIGVLFPASTRGTKLQLWDRATDRRWDLAWPPSDTRDGGIAEGR